MTRKILFVLLAIATSFLFEGCLKDELTKTYTILRPVYKEKSEVYSSIRSTASTSIQNPGKIFMYGNYIFLNEIEKGVHVIDNTNPSNPVNKAFISIPGNIDIAVKGNTLYADIYTDLVVVDISNPLDAGFIKYIADVFPNRNYTNGFMADSNRIIVDWIKKDTTVRMGEMCNRCDYIMLSSSSSGGGIGFTGPVGVSGSMARFALVNNFLYTVNNSRLTSFDISNTVAPVQTANQMLGWNIETIFPFKNKLFIGSRTGMFIYDINNPASPLYQGQFNHMQSCDPVIADDHYAYVTLRSGNACGDLQSRLDVININNVLSPSLLKSYNLKNPYGITKEGNLLFVCDGTAGLKMYDAMNPQNLILKTEITGIETFDAIALNGNLLVVAKDGLYQYDFTSASLTLKSKIAVNRN
jgi:hypothetical protein